ncbi:MAG: BON domain-containing protein [Ginsengibacter sp.]
MKTLKILSSVFLLVSMLFFSCAPKDSDVQLKVNEKFTASPNLMGASATVAGGVATLTGQVQDDAAKTDAETSAKDVKGVKSVVNNLTLIPPPPPPPPPVTVNPDSTLTQGVTDATKDFPTVKAAVSNGEITLTGSIKRADLQKLMQTLNTLNPSKINNQLTIK